MYKSLIEPHAPLLTKPEQGTLLYKIVLFRHFIDMLKDGCLYFRRVDTYKDDLRDSDQTNKDKQISKTSKFEKAPNKTAEDYYHATRARTYAACFSTQNTPYIWNEYSKYNGTVDKNAVCLVFDAEKFITFLNTTYDNSKIYSALENFFLLNHGLVEYINLEKDSLINTRYLNPIQYSYLKDCKYSSENEFRSTLFVPGFGQYILPDNTVFNFPDLIKFPFRFESAIKSGVITRIELSVSHESKFLEELREELFLKGINLYV